MPWFSRAISALPAGTCRLSGEQLEPRLALSNVPVLFVPGQPASLPRDVLNDLNAGRFVQAGIDLNRFFTHLGTRPEALTTEFDVKPLGITSPSNPLIKALRDVGYQDGVDLFAAVHDWRMPIAPADGTDDGFLANVTAALMTNGRFDYGVSYLGYWLKKAEAAWHADPTNTGPFPGVDVISHSEGNLLVRAYVSSAAYLDPSMPKINTWVAAAPPFQGVSGIYNLLTNNFANPLGSDVLNGALYPFVEVPYIQVASFGGTIYGPDGGAAITRASINDPLTGKPDPYRFMEQYIPSLWSENATYAFLDGHTVNADPRYRNALMLDLNWTPSGDVSTEFVSDLGSFAVVYGTKNTTLTYAVTQPAAFIKPVLPLVANVQDIVGVFNYKPWVKDVSVASNGDGLIPVVSAVPPSFVGNSDIRLLPQTYNVHGQPVDHNDTISDPKSVQAILGELGYVIGLSTITAKSNAKSNASPAASKAGGLSIKMPVAWPTGVKGRSDLSIPFGFLSTTQPSKPLAIVVPGVLGSVPRPTAMQVAQLFAAFAGPVSTTSLFPPGAKPRR